MLRARRAQFDVLVQWAPVIAGALTDPGSAERQQLLERWDARLAAFAADTGLSTADRLDALATRAELQKLGDPNAPVSPALAEAIRTQRRRPTGTRTIASSARR